MKVIQTKKASDHNAIMIEIINLDGKRKLKKLKQLTKNNAKIKMISRKVLKMLTREKLDLQKAT